jgi:hypothetical protein
MMLQGERAPAGVVIIGLQAGKGFRLHPNPKSTLSHCSPRQRDPRLHNNTFRKGNDAHRRRRRWPSNWTGLSPEAWGPAEVGTQRQPPAALGPRGKDL